MANGRVRTCDRSGVRVLQDATRCPYQHRQFGLTPREARQSRRAPGVRTTIDSTSRPADGCGPASGRACHEHQLSRVAVHDSTSDTLVDGRSPTDGSTAERPTSAHKAPNLDLAIGAPRQLLGVGGEAGVAGYDERVDGALPVARQTGFVGGRSDLYEPVGQAVAVGGDRPGICEHCSRNPRHTDTGLLGNGER